MLALGGRRSSSYQIKKSFWCFKSLFTFRSSALQTQVFQKDMFATALLFDFSFFLK